MEIKDSYRSGAIQIIQRCLGLQSGQNLLIFTDESSHSLAALLSDSGLQVGVQSTIIYVPTEQQRLISPEHDLSFLIQNAARDARAILTCVNGSPECLPFRDRILESHWNSRTRIGHMPGAIHEILELANVDLDRLIVDCHRVELAMARGKELELISNTSQGETHILKTQLGSWNRLPVASNGVVTDGVWGNVPSGETFIAPLEGSAEGSLVINGSIPGMVVSAEHEFVMEFREGRLVRITPENTPEVQFLHKTQISVAKSRGDVNWDNLAEIGIGLNPGVKELTGNMLLDEKCAGTAHIALGDNNFMGGKIIAAIHCDIVVRNPTINIDGKPVLEKGNLILQDSDWCDDYSDVVANSTLLNANQVSYSGTQVEVVSGCLHKVLRSETGRKSSYPVGNAETSKLANNLYSYLPHDGTWISIEDICTEAKVDEPTVRKIFQLMTDFELIRCS